MPISVTNIDDVALDMGVISCPEPSPLPTVSGYAWNWGHDVATAGSSCGNSSLVSSPSVSGQARRFDVSWSGGGGERFNIFFGNGNLDAADTHFKYECDFRSTDFSNVNNLEFDLNQVIPNGKTVIYGIQFNFSAGFIQYTANIAGVDTWVSSTIACTRPTANAWHHLILNYRRDSAGNVTYESFNLDSVNHPINITVNSGFSLGWTPIGALVLNFQVGGTVSTASTICYLDNLNITGSGSSLTVPTSSVGTVLSRIPGFSDIPDSTLVAESPALGIYLARINDNAAFGMVRMEIFSGFYHDGETVVLPTSQADGYNYSFEELTFCWAIANSTNPSSGWITGPDSLWYGAWLVDQTTGLVSSSESYRKSGSHPDSASSNDGTLQVFTVAQRLRTTILVAEQQDAYTDLADTEFVVDAPLSQRLIRGLNDNAKFTALNAECIYCGEFKHGDTVPAPKSPADGYQYTYAETFFTFSWRWTPEGAFFSTPDLALGQLDRIGASVSSVGVVGTSIFYIDSGSPIQQTSHGRIAVFAFCSRSDLIDTIPSLSDDFTEIDPSTFMPGETLRASNLLQTNKNIREAACSPEFFGPVNYNNGDIIPLPVSPLDGYTYSRDELRYIWDWAHTTPQSTGNHIRLPAFLASISTSTGLITVKVFRLPPGGPYVTEPSGDSDDAIRVLVVGIRGAQLQVITSGTTGTPPVTTTPGGTTTTTIVDNGPADIQPYGISYFEGDTAQPAANQLLLRHFIAGANALSSVSFPISLSGSTGGCVTAPTSAYVITIKHNGSSVGSINIASGATTATFTFAAAVTSSPGDTWDFVGQATPDTTLAGLAFTLSGTRT